MSERKPTSAPSISITLHGFAENVTATVEKAAPIVAPVEPGLTVPQVRGGLAPGDRFKHDRPFQAYVGATHAEVVYLNKHEAMYVQLGAWRDTDLVDVRVHIAWGKDEDKATPKGFTISPAKARIVGQAMIEMADRFDQGA